MDRLTQTPLTINLVNAGFVAGATNTYTTSADTRCIINGKFATTLSSGNNASPTTDATTGLAFVPVPYNYATVLVWGTNAAGAVKCAQGTIVPTEAGVTTTVGAFKTAPQFPALPDDFCPCAYQLVRVAPTGSSFTAGTTQWAASGITCSTMQNIATLPDRPQIA